MTRGKSFASGLSTDRKDSNDATRQWINHSFQLSSFGLTIMDMNNQQSTLKGPMRSYACQIA